MKTSTTEQVRQKIEDEINQGRLLPGDALNEAELAKRFRVSRTPAREALLQLAAQGIVVIVPRSGIYVSRMSLKELLAMFEVLAELEGICAKFAARRMEEAERARLRDIHEASLKADDPVSYARLNADFHELVYAGARNPFLADQIRYIRRRTQAYRQNPFQQAWRIARSREEHGRVIAAILAADGAAAYEHMSAHIAVGGKEFAEFVSAIPSQLLASHAQAYPGPEPAQPSEKPRRAKRPGTKRELIAES